MWNLVAISRNHQRLIWRQDCNGFWFDDCCAKIQDFSVPPPIGLTRVENKCIFHRDREVMQRRSFHFRSHARGQELWGGTSPKWQYQISIRVHRKMVWKCIFLVEHKENCECPEQRLKSRPINQFIQKRTKIIVMKWCEPYLRRIEWHKTEATKAD